MSTLIACCAHAAPPPYTGPDFSGTYNCTGEDSHEGPYKGTVTLALVRAQSTGAYGAYEFKLEVPGYGAYPGEAAAHGMEMAIHFANTDPKTKDFGTGIGMSIVHSFVTMHDGRIDIETGPKGTTIDVALPTRHR